MMCSVPGVLPGSPEGHAVESWPNGRSDLSVPCNYPTCLEAGGSPIASHVLLGRRQMKPGGTVRQKGSGEGRLGEFGPVSGSIHELWNIFPLGRKRDA